MAAEILRRAVVTVVVLPGGLLALLALAAFVTRLRTERLVAACVGLVMLCQLGAAIAASVAYASLRAGPMTLSPASSVAVREAGLEVTFLVDWSSLAFVTFASATCGLTAAFSYRYLHRDPGFHRYFLQFALFTLGMTLIALAGSIEVLFAGWEMVGLSSVLLVAFFHERRAPVVNALRVMATYRASDAAMLLAAVLLHHWAGSGSLSLLFSGSVGQGGVLRPGHGLLIAVLLIVAVAAKSALLPFSGWLPRAMEGPTPSSAIYYGALSLHAGCFLLLRARPLLAQSTLALVLVALAGVATGVYATLVARVQTDVKSALAFATLTQVGVIVVEIALGLTTLAFVHMLGHACFRILQFLSAPNILHDLHDLHDRLGQPRHSSHAPSVAPARGPSAAYLFALERGFVDALVDRLLVDPLVGFARRLDRLDRWLCGHRPAPRAGAGE